MNLGTVIHGTTRFEDLLPAFIAEMRSREDDPTFGPSEERESFWHDAHAELNELEWRMKRSNYFNDEEEATEDLWAIIDDLCIIAPEGYTFATHPGDGSDWGWWPVEWYEV